MARRSAGGTGTAGARADEPDTDGVSGQGGTEGVAEDAAGAGDGTAVVYFMPSDRRDEGGQVAALTGLQEKTVSLYRRHVLCALGMEEVKSGMPLYRGVMVRESLQRYPSGAGLTENRYGQPGREERMADKEGEV